MIIILDCHAHRQTDIQRNYYWYVQLYFSGELSVFVLNIHLAGDVHDKLNLSSFLGIILCFSFP